MLLKGQVVVVTGGGRGIGRAIAKKFASAGAAVVVTARSENEVAQVAREIADAGGQSAFVVADVSRESDCEKIVTRGARPSAPSTSSSITPGSSDRCNQSKISVPQLGTK